MTFSSGISFSTLSVEPRDEGALKPHFDRLASLIEQRTMMQFGAERRTHFINTVALRAQAIYLDLASCLNRLSLPGSEVEMLALNDQRSVVMAEKSQLEGDELAELREFFFVQATEVIDSLGGLILKVENDPADTETLRAIRRAAHTLKGDSTAFGFTELTGLAHQCEGALDRLREREGAASRELIDLLLAGADALAALISFYQGAGDQPEVARLIAGLATLRESDLMISDSPHCPQQQSRLSRP
jgi:HPt (histidine-containing phosphotransfer) domain-containing protein